MPAVSGPQQRAAGRELGLRKAKKKKKTKRSKRPFANATIAQLREFARRA